MRLALTMPQKRNQGRLPFRVRIGVTGHRSRGRRPLSKDDPRLLAEVRGQIERVVGFFGDDATPVHLGVVSQLADGADRLVVNGVIAEARERQHEARLEAFLPMRRHDYEKTQKFDANSIAEFDRLLERATVKREPMGVGPDTQAERESAYAAGSRRLVARCDILIALWDGGSSGGPGGTAETLAYAASRSKPCIWIPTKDGLPTRDNFELDSAREFFEEIFERAKLGKRTRIEWSGDDEQRDVMESLSTAFDFISEFNREQLEANLTEISQRELDPRGNAATWVAAPFVRATVLAERWQRRFRRAATVITMLATMAASMLALGLSYGRESEGWSSAEAAFFFLALIGLLVVRRYEFHRRWLSYRVLAERLRSAYFLAPTGADFRRQARLETVYAGSESTGWLMRAFEEVWDRRPRARPPTELDENELKALRARLAEDWIGQQIEYHEATIERHRQAQKILTGSIFALFVATIVFAVLHSLHVAENAAVFFSIVLPAAGASLGVILTVNQHQALSERSARMCTDLAIVKRDVCDATADTLDQAGSEAARVIAQENGAWFGSMWFLDIEHP